MNEQRTIEQRVCADCGATFPFHHAVCRTYLELEVDRGDEIRQLRERFDRMVNAFRHIHVHARGGVVANGDECLQCGLDLRHEVHQRVRERQ